MAGNPSDLASPRFGWRELLPLIAPAVSVVFSIGAAIWFCSAYVERLDQVEAKEAAIELRLQKQTDDLASIRDVTSRTDATLSVLRDRQGRLQP